MAGALRKVGLYLGLVDDEAYDDYVEDDYLEPEPEEPPRSSTVRRFDERAARYEEPQPRAVRSAGVDRVQMAPPAPAAPEPELYRITTLHPRNYNEARTIGESFRDGTPVIMNLTEMSDGDAKRLVDFSAGLIFGLRGSIERVTNKVFLLSPANVHVTAEDKARIVEGGFFNQS
ncbi:MAG: cell division inhibitor SepF [Frankiales bacterium]|jgi:cell division inhibitor SepF|nr:cell division inhibitor SepF [Frankiales bacterium]MDX6244763.1 cell division inhibitor SepF [Frankiales bacterium]